MSIQSTPKIHESEISTLDLDGQIMLEQAEFLAKLAVNANLDSDDSTLALCWLAEILHNLRLQLN